jgi:hypothetical protein
MILYALVVMGQINATYSDPAECENAANKMAGEQYRAITQWPGGKSLKKEGDEWRVVMGGDVVFRVSCQAKTQLTEEEHRRADQGNMERDSEQSRAALFAALQTRVLTDDEMNRVLAYGEMINITIDQSYYPEEKSRERTEAFQRQILLRSIRSGQ